MDLPTGISRRAALAGGSLLAGSLGSVRAAAAPARPAGIVLPPTGVARGYCDPAFREVAVEFERNFKERREIGASACVIHKGRVVADLWGGKKNEKEPWEEDTMVVVYSCTKGATAICLHILASKGALSFDDPVGRYWPAFKSADKSAITIRMLLNMSSGLVGTSHKLTLAELYDWDHMVRLMEQETPVWRPGSRWGYHGMTFGFLNGEVVRRVTGESIGTFLRKNVAGPLGADMRIGIQKSEEHRVATTVMAPWKFDEFKLDWSAYADALAKGDPIQVKQWNSLEAFMTPGACDSPGAHEAELPSIGGVANARGLARLYQPLAKPSNQVTLVSPDQHQQMIEVESAGECAVTMVPLRFSTGFERGKPGDDAVKTFNAQVHGEQSFGFSGFGSSLGFADPDAEFSFGYAMNRHSDTQEPYFLRAQSMVDAVYRKLGYVSKSSGRWRR